MTTPPAHPALMLPGQHASPEGPVDLSTMYVMHHAFRRDLARILAATETTRLTDQRRWVALRARWRLLATVLHHHHDGEDAGLWPLLQERVTGSDHAVLEAMRAEHALIDPLLDACAAGFDRLVDADVDHRDVLRGSLLSSLRDAGKQLDAHMGHEERDALRLVQQHLNDEDWLRIERDHFRAAYSIRDLLTIVPWSLAGLSEKDRNAVLEAAGPLLSLLWRLTRRRFARRDEETFGPSVPGLIDHRSTVAVVGATGTVGGIVVDELATRGVAIRVLVRATQPEATFAPGVSQVVADLRDEESLRRALDGVRAALYISPHDPDEETLAANFVRAAAATGTRVVFAGVHLPSRNPVEWLQLKVTERLLKSYRPKLRIGQMIAATAIEPVIFSPTNFFQNDEIFEADIRDGWAFPMPMRKVNRVDVRDLAELCARALVEPGYPAGQHMIAGPASLSGEECANEWALALGKPVTYIGNDDVAWLEIVHRRMHGQKMLDFINTSTFLGRNTVVVPKAVASTTALLGREPRGYRDYVADRASLLSDRTAVEVCDR